MDLDKCVGALVMFGFEGPCSLIQHPWNCIPFTKHQIEVAVCICVYLQIPLVDEDEEVLAVYLGLLPFYMDILAVTY